MPRRYTWRVTYRDGSDDSETGLGTFAKVRAAEVERLDLWPETRLRSAKAAAISVRVPAGARAVFGRRSLQIIDLNNGQQHRKRVATIAGWQGQGTESYVFLLEDGGMVLSSNLHEV